jgi:tight adherence protein C
MLRFAIICLASLAAFASVLAVALPLLARNRFASRLKAVTSRRQELSRAQRANLKGRRKSESRVALMRAVINRLKLEQLLESKALKARLASAGWRSRSAPLTYIFSRIAAPVVCFAVAICYVTTVFAQMSLTGRLTILIGAVAAGLYLPAILVTNAIQKRQQAIGRAFPDALDLMVICVDSGLSIDATLSRTVEELGTAAPELAEELGLTGAELAFLTERRQAWSNLADRTGLGPVKSLATTLLQTDRYGTPVGQALRVLADENRQTRMAAAEKKAAALPAKLTVPMILFFMPVLFMAIIGPAVIQVMAMMRH